MKEPPLKHRRKVDLKGANRRLWKTGRWVSQIRLQGRSGCLAVKCVVSWHFLLTATNCQILQGLPQQQRPASPKGKHFLGSPHQVTEQGRQDLAISAWPRATVTGHCCSRGPHELGKALSNLHCSLIFCSFLLLLPSFPRSWFLISISHPKLCLTSASGESKLLTAFLLRENNLIAEQLVNERKRFGEDF